jgi:hypothetical protein
MLRSILSCLMLLMIFGCGVRSASELTGVYKAKYTHGTETLSLAAGGTFVQIYTQAKDGRATTNAGTWAFSKKDGDITLKNAYSFDEYGRQQEPPYQKTVLLLRTANRLGQISLVYGERGVEEYEKVP